MTNKEVKDLHLQSRFPFEKILKNKKLTDDEICSILDRYVEGYRPSRIAMFNSKNVYLPSFKFGCFLPVPHCIADYDIDERFSLASLESASSTFNVDLSYHIDDRALKESDVYESDVYALLCLVNHAFHEKCILDAIAQRVTNILKERLNWDTVPEIEIDYKCKDILCKSIFHSILEVRFKRQVEVLPIIDLVCFTSASIFAQLFLYVFDKGLYPLVSKTIENFDIDPMHKPLDNKLKNDIVDKIKNADIEPSVIHADGEMVADCYRILRYIRTSKRKDSTVNEVSKDDHRRDVVYWTIKKLVLNEHPKLTQSEIDEFLRVMPGESEAFLKEVSERNDGYFIPYIPARWMCLLTYDMYKDITNILRTCQKISFE